MYKHILGTTLIYFEYFALEISIIILNSDTLDICIRFYLSLSKFSSLKLLIFFTKIKLNFIIIEFY